MATSFIPLRDAVKHWYLPLIAGLLFIACGIYIYFVPLETYLTLSILFSISFIVSGITDIYFSISNRKIVSSWGWHLISGLLSLAIGIYLLSYPAISLATLPYVVAFTLLYRSFIQLGFSFDMKDRGLDSWSGLGLSSF